MGLALSCARGSATAGKARPTNAMRDIVEEAQRSQRSQTPAPLRVGAAWGRLRCCARSTMSPHRHRSRANATSARLRSRRSSGPDPRGEHPAPRRSQLARASARAGGPRESHHGLLALRPSAPDTRDRALRAGLPARRPRRATGGCSAHRRGDTTRACATRCPRRSPPIDWLEPPGLRCRARCAVFSRARSPRGDPHPARRYRP